VCVVLIAIEKEERKVKEVDNLFIKQTRKRNPRKQFSFVPVTALVKGNNLFT